MSENTAVEIETAALETLLVEDVETDDELTLEEIVNGLTRQKFEKVGTSTISPYAISKIINEVFMATGTSKEIPPQMMYIYASKGMIAGKDTKGSKEYTYEQVCEFVNKYTKKHVNI